MNGKTQWITGLKGIFALVVLLRHYANGLFPALHTGNSADARLFLRGMPVSVEEIINRTPLYFFINGGFAVFVFWTLSAFLLSDYYFTHEATCIDMRKKAFKRYLSVFFPIAVSYAVVYVMLKAGLFYNAVASTCSKSDWLANFYNFVPTAPHVLRCLFVDTFFTANVPYNPVLWTIEIEVKGSFFLALFLHLFGSMKHRGKFILIMLAVVLYTARLQYLCFIFGMVLADVKNRQIQNPAKAEAENIYGIFAISLFLAGYPSDFVPTGIYGLFPATITLINQVWDTRTLIYVTAAVGIVFSVSYLDMLRMFFSKKIFVLMGCVSTEVYMVHLIVECSISSVLLVKLSAATGSYALSSLITLAASITIIYCVAIPFHRLNKWYGKHLDKWLTKAVE